MALTLPRKVALAGLGLRLGLGLGLGLWLGLGLGLGLVSGDELGLPLLPPSKLPLPLPLSHPDVKLVSPKWAPWPPCEMHNIKSFFILGLPHRPWGEPIWAGYDSWW